MDSLQVDSLTTSAMPPDARARLIGSVGLDGIAELLANQTFAGLSSQQARKLKHLQGEAQWQAEEGNRLLRGEDPRPSPRNANYVLPAACGDAAAAVSLIENSPDFQRGHWAAWLCNVSAPLPAARAALEVVLVQDNFFREIPDPWGCLAYASFPPPRGRGDRLTVWQGDDGDCLSWSLSKKVAERFAQLFGTGVKSRTIGLDEVAFFSDLRGEAEVILWPASLKKQ